MLSQDIPYEPYQVSHKLFSVVYNARLTSEHFLCGLTETLNSH